MENKLNSSNFTLFFVGNGCPESRNDVASAEHFFAQKKFNITKDWRKADIILFRACGLTEDTTKQSLRIIKEIERNKKENQKCLVWGCLPKIDLNTLKKECYEFLYLDSELINLQKDIYSELGIDQTKANILGRMWSPIIRDVTFNDIIKIFKKPTLIRDRLFYPKFLSSGDPSIFYIRISTGCMSSCTYCAISKSRGFTKSKKIDEILAEFEQGLELGFKKFYLLGTDIGSYGADIGCDLVDLLTSMVNRKENFQLILRHANPYHLIKMLPKFNSILKSHKISHLEIPVETGSNRILKLMNRNYTIEEYNALIKEIRLFCPQIIIITQIMVGFPTETEEDFRNTLQLIDDLIFDQIEIYEFSSRPGTIAEKIEPKVPSKIQRYRYQKLYRKYLFNTSFRKLKKCFFK